MSYISEIAEIIHLCRAIHLAEPERVIADNSWWNAVWPGGISLSRSHGEPTIIAESPDGRTEHTSLVHALRRVELLLDTAKSAA